MNIKRKENKVVEILCDGSTLSVEDDLPAVFHTIRSIFRRDLIDIALDSNSRLFTIHGIANYARIADCLRLLSLYRIDFDDRSFFDVV